MALNKWQLKYNSKKEKAYSKLTSSFPNDYESNLKSRKAYNRKYRRYNKKFSLSAEDAYKVYSDRKKFYSKNTPIIIKGSLLMFILIMFFGGFTQEIIDSHNVHEENVYNSEIDLDYFEYDFTYKLNQLSQLRNLFYLPKDSMINYDDVSIWLESFKYYYDKGAIYYTDTWHYNPTDLKEYEKNDSLKAYDYLVHYKLSPVDFYKPAREVYLDVVDNNIITNNVYDRTLKQQNEGFFSVAERVLKFFTIIPMFFVNLGYDLGVIARFVFDW